ncbi:MAG: AraC family transcriptional regulator [Roseovarius sp.]
MLDLLSDILTKVSVRGTLYFRTAFSNPWGVAVPRHENVARFHFAHRGGCLVAVEGMSAPVAVAQGDLIIIPHGAAHEMYCSPETRDAVLPLETVLERSGYTGSGVLVYGGGDVELGETQLICGHFAYEDTAKHVLLERLPPIIHLKNYGEAAGRWMEATLRVIGDEAGGHRMGGDLIALKMSEAILAQAIRCFLESQDAVQWGLGGFVDPHLSKALDAFHKAPAEAWTIEGMARVAGLSRTGFAVLFQKKLQMTPMQYVTAWRMEIAKSELCAAGASLTQAAERAGYASDSAFARVFKKETGMTPAGFRKFALSQVG